VAFAGLTISACLTVAIVLVGIFLVVFPRRPRRDQGLRATFLTTSSWNPVTGEYGAFTAIYGLGFSPLLGVADCVPLELHGKFSSRKSDPTAWRDIIG